MNFLSHAVLFMVFAINSFTSSPMKKQRIQRIPKSKISLLRIVPTTDEQLSYLKSLRKDRKGLKMQFWRRPDKINRHVDVLILELSMKRFWLMMNSKRIKYSVITEDIITSCGKPYISMNYIESFDGVYQNAEDIASEIRRLTTAHRNMVTLDTIGNSTQGTPIYIVHFHKGAAGSKKTIFILCGTHPREWLGIAACMYVLRKIMFDHKYDGEISSMLENYDLVMVPLLNPDGYEYSKKTSRMWRKSRSKSKDPKCRGVDLNRNFNYWWGGGGSSPDPCNGIYSGERPFSEIESLVVARYLYQNRRNIVAFLDIHTFGQLWMNPWGFTPSFPRDNVRQEKAMMVIQRSIKQKNRQLYHIGRSATQLYAASGTALDWTYGRLGIVHSYAIELRPRRRRITVDFNGFDVSRRYIVPTGKDLIVGLKALVSVMIKEKEEN